MRDAMGSVVILEIIVTFVVIVLAYLAFNVNYTKAFRMKDKVIAIYDDYNGNCDSDACEAEIIDYAKQIGYSMRKLNCPKDFTNSTNNIYCYKENTIKAIDPDEKALSVGDQTYYTIVTKINLDIPIINNILNLEYFYISGDTKIYSK